MIAMYPCAGEGEGEDDVGDVPCSASMAIVSWFLGFVSSSLCVSFACCSSVDSIVCVME